MCILVYIYMCIKVIYNRYMLYNNFVVIVIINDKFYICLVFILINK